VWKGVAIWQNRRQRGERRRRNREERQHEQRKKEQKRRRNCLNTLKPLKGGMGAERPARGNDRGGGLRLSTVGVSMGLESPWKGAWALSADGDSPGAGACGGQFWRGEKKGERKESERASERGEERPLEARSVPQRQRSRGTTFWGTQTSWATSLAAVQRLLRHKGVGAHTSSVSAGDGGLPEVPNTKAGKDVEP